MITLYHNDMSVCAQKVRIALAEKGVEWRGRHLDLRRGDQFDPAYLKLNPNAVVPTLVNDGFVVIDSTLINEYLDDALPGPALRPADAEGRARMRAWTKQLDDNVHAATGTMSVSIAFRHQYIAAYSPEELEASIDKIPGASRRARRRDIIFNGVGCAAFPAAIRRIDKLLNDIEAALQDGPWLAGDTYSLADIGFTSYMTRLEHLKLGEMIERRPRLHEWNHRLKARPSHAEGIGAWLNQSYLSLMAEKGAEERDKVYAALNPETSTPKTQGDAA